jgi:hypothetical protein
MPRWASRITLDVESVRVERVQEITDDDADREGVVWMAENHMTNKCRRHSPTYSADGVCGDHGYCECGNYRDSELFSGLWNTINAARGYGWGANPWVWVVVFRVLEEKR